jgi:hypothetical protein
MSRVHGEVGRLGQAVTVVIVKRAMFMKEGMADHSASLCLATMEGI